MPLPPALPPKSGPIGKKTTKFDPTHAPTPTPTQPAQAPLFAPNPPTKRGPLTPFAAADETDSDNDDDNHTVQNTKPSLIKPVGEKKVKKPKPTATIDNSVLVQLNKTPSTSTQTSKNDTKLLEGSVKKQQNDKKGLDDLWSTIKQPRGFKTQKRFNSIMEKRKTQAQQVDSQQPQALSGADDMGFLETDKIERKLTEEGWKVYSYEELKFEEGGDTPDCPFDCDCCYA
jgi:hypothetical protein